jgi:hypothetical protein
MKTTYIRSFASKALKQKIAKINTDNLHLANTSCLQPGIDIDNVIEHNDQSAQTTYHYISSNRHGSRQGRYTKPTPQPEKTVGRKPTAADKNPTTIATDGKHNRHSAPNDKLDKNTQPNNIYNNKIHGIDDTSHNMTSIQT